jgi:hypothetical protein
MKTEKYLPIDKTILLEQQIEDNHFSEKDSVQFKKLFSILEHYFHYEGFHLIQNIKKNYAAFDPDKSEKERTLFREKSTISDLNHSLNEVLENANYEQIRQEVIDAAINNSDLVGLQLKINFDDFQEYKVFARGLNKTTEKVKNWFFWEKEVELEYYDFVFIYIHYKDQQYFDNQKVKIDKLPFSPGSIILKIFKKVPQNDLDTIFPNATPRMSMKDKLLLWIPGLVGGISLLSTKVIPPIIAIYSAYKTGEILNLNNSKTSLVQGLVALGVLGMYLFRQYSNYISKKIKFAKMLSDSLYFKNLGNNSGVFPLLVDTSEDEELKETILAYSFLNKSSEPLTSSELDAQIEAWLATTFQIKSDFDIEDALYKLKKIGLGTESNGKWSVVPLSEAYAKVDDLWDGIFSSKND